MQIDHLAIACSDLDTGVEYASDLLGVAIAGGGKHAAFGTHNRLLSLGPNEYLEVIAVDPEAPPPAYARWFGLDDFSGPPRLTNWIVRVDHMARAKQALGIDDAQVHELSRGQFSWQMAVPTGGQMPFGGVLPAPIKWHGTAHPAAHLPESGCRLRALRLTHPSAENLRLRLNGLVDSRISTATAAPAGLCATIETPTGTVVLG